MRLLDFGESATFPVTAFGSRAQQSPLMGQSDVGERHTSGTDTGMVAVVVEGDFEVEIPEL